MKHYSTTLDLSLGGDSPDWEGEVTVCYAVTWGRPAIGPSYSHGGLPADPDEINDITVTHIDGAVVVGEGLKEHAALCEAAIESNDALIGLLLEHAYEVAAEQHAAAMEYRAEDRRELGSAK